MTGWEGVRLTPGQEQRERRKLGKGGSENRFQNSTVDGCRLEAPREMERLDINIGGKSGASIVSALLGCIVP